MRLQKYALPLLACLGVCSAEWQRVDGIEGGGVRSLATDGSILYAGTHYGGVYRSLDSGSSWVPVNTVIDPTGGVLNTRTISSLTAYGGKMFAGTDGGVYGSLDSGRSWAKEGNGIMANRNVWAMFGTDSNLFVAADLGECWRYSIRDKTWHSVNNGHWEFGSFTAKDGILFAGTLKTPSYSPNGVVRSLDNGSTWETTGNQLQGIEIHSLASAGPYLFAGTSSQGIYRSADSGTTWLQMNAGLEDSVVRSIFVKGGLLYAGTQSKGIFRSRDQGITWQAANAGLKNAATTHFPAVNAFTLLGDLVLAGTNGGGIFRTDDDGERWSGANHGMLNTFIKILLRNGGDLIAGTLYGGVFRSADNGVTWTPDNEGLPSPTVSALAADGNVLYAGLFGVGLFRLDRPGGTWVRIGEGTALKYANCIRATGPTLIATSDGSGIFRSLDGGATWNKVSPSPYAATWLVESGAHLFAAGNGIYRSSDGGGSWVDVTGGLKADLHFETYPTIRGLAAIDSNLSIMINYYTYGSGDAGATWSRMDKGGHGDVTSFAAIRSELYFGVNAGYIYRSPDGGKSWNSIGDDWVPKSPVTALASTATHLFAGTQGSGVWKRAFSEFSPVAVRSSYPALTADGFANLSSLLHPGQSFGIRIQVPGRVVIRLFDGRGKEAETLADGNLRAGDHQIRFEGAGLRSGLYFLTMKTPDHTGFRRVVVVK